MKRKKILISLSVLFIFFVVLTNLNSINKAKIYKKVPLSTNMKKTSTTDHSKFEILKQKFKDPKDVTKACLSCHVKAGEQILISKHWTWICPKKQVGDAGKKFKINNFCISLQSNEPRCTSCHIGYGWKDKNFDFKNPDNIDCLVCHEQTGTYKKFPTAAGYPVMEEKVFKGKKWFPPNLSKVAQSVTFPSIKNCGVCHFYGGGGDGVKHGDLDSSLYNPSRDLDVHLSKDGAGMDCVECHRTVNHKIGGGCTSRLDEGDKFKAPVVTCTDCHSQTPHSTVDYKYADIINQHVDKVSCQACHIPEFAREKPTKMYWDWSKAGKRDENGKPIVKKENGVMVYHGMKGAFVWKKNVVPEYFWWNKKGSVVLATDKIDPSKQPIQINKLEGNYFDKDSKIYPFKVHRGKQVYDPIYKNFIMPKLFGKKGTGAYWAEYDWVKAAKAGMDYVGLPFSGKVDFIETEMFWPQNHMVAPEEKALRCDACHSENSRLKNLEGVYLVGKDRSNFFDFIGILIILLSLVGVLIHGLIRVVSSFKR